MSLPISAHQLLLFISGFVRLWSKCTAAKQLYFECSWEGSSVV